MNSSRYKKVLGLALGDKSLLIAELSAADKPQVRKLAELVYPEGVSPKQPEELGIVLKQFLAENEFSAKAAVIGIPVKWLLVKPKDVPPADAAVLANMLRLQAETDFSAEIKDLVYDYADEQDAKTARTVLLMATPRKHIEWINQLCDAAQIKAIAMMPSVLALGTSTGGALDRAVLVLSVGAGGSELTAQDKGASSAIRHLRSADPRQPFISELRRTVSTLGAAPGIEREMVIWGSDGMDSEALGKDVGVLARRGKLGLLGVDTSIAGSNGEAHKYAAAVALALSAMRENGPAVDFLHSRLRPPNERRVPRWAILAGVAVIAAIVGGIFAYNDLQAQQADLDHMLAAIKSNEPAVTAAKAFNNTVTTAEKWHAGSPRYLACVRDLTMAIPNNAQTYATILTLKEISLSSGASSAKDPNIGKLEGTLEGKTSDQQQALALPDRLKVRPAFGNVILESTTNLPRERAVSFTISFKYDPTKATP